MVLNAIAFSRAVEGLVAQGVLLKDLRGVAGGVAEDRLLKSGLQGLMTFEKCCTQ